MPWFRWRRKHDTQDEAGAVAPAAQEAPAPAEPVALGEAEPGEPPAEGEAPKPKRRRGTRGGRGRKKPATANAAADGRHASRRAGA